MDCICCCCCICMLHRDHNLPLMPFRIRLEGPLLSQCSLRGPVLGYLGLQFVVLLSELKAIEAFISSQEQHKYIEKSVLSCIGRLLLHLGPRIRFNRSEASLS